MKKINKKSVLTLRREGPKGPEGLHEVSRFSKYLHLKQFISLNEIKMTSARSTLLLIHFFFFARVFARQKKSLLAFLTLPHRKCRVVLRFNPQSDFASPISFRPPLWNPLSPYISIPLNAPSPPRPRHHPSCQHYNNGAALVC